MSQAPPQLVDDVMAAVAAFQEGTDAVDDAAAVRLGVNRTDLRCLGILSRCGELTAGELAAEVGLSTGATTTAIDRLARTGYVERTRSEADRRRVAVQLTSRAATLLQEIWGPIGQESQQLLLNRGEAELRVIHDFLKEGREFQLAHAARISQSNSLARHPSRHG